jgi:hypothetical protein
MVLTDVRSEYYVASLPAVNQRIPSYLSKDQLTEYIPNLSPTSLDTRNTKRLTVAGDVGLRFCNVHGFGKNKLYFSAPGTFRSTIPPGRQRVGRTRRVAEFETQDHFYPVAGSSS